MKSRLLCLGVCIITLILLCVVNPMEEEVQVNGIILMDNVSEEVYDRLGLNTSENATIDFNSSRDLGFTHLRPGQLRIRKPEPNDTYLSFNLINISQPIIMINYLGEIYVKGELTEDNDIIANAFKEFAREYTKEDKRVKEDSKK